MAVTEYTATLIAQAKIDKRKLPQGVLPDMVRDLAPEFTEDAQHNDTVSDEWIEKRDYLKDNHSGKIDLALERNAFGADATPAGRGKLYRVYGPELFEQRRRAWGASAGTIKSGKEPDSEKMNTETVKKAKKVIDEQFATSPFNPGKTYLSAETRAADCARFIRRWGTRHAVRAAKHFQVDIAGRPLRKRA